MIKLTDFEYSDHDNCEIATDGDYRIRIEQDENCPSPREWSNLGKMYYRHSRYILGDTEIPEADSDYNAIDNEKTFKVWVEATENDKVAICIPLEIYDHSGVTMWAGHNPNHPDYQWDCSHVGWIVAMKKAVLDNYGGKRLTKSVLDKAEKVLRNEVKTFDDFLTGNCYGYVVEKHTKCDKCGNEEWEHLDSCWGYLGDNDYCKTEAINAYKSIIKV